MITLHERMLIVITLQIVQRDGMSAPYQSECQHSGCVAVQTSTRLSCLGAG